MSDEKMFPIMGTQISGQSWSGGLIPWSLIEPHGAQALRNHGQTLKELASRGGLSWSEAHAILHDRPWKRMAPDDAKCEVMAIVSAFQDAAP